MDGREAARRRFLQALGGSAGALWLGANWPEFAAAAEHAHAAAASSPTDHTLRFLTAGEARDVAAIAAQIVPGGATPGASEAGVVYFIDHVLAGVYADKAGGFRDALSGFQAEFAKAAAGGRQFADLAGDAQLDYLKRIEQTPFFGQMRFLTVLGLLASPAYGGNEQQAGWKLVGFDDRHVWSPPFGHYDAGYTGFEAYGTQERTS